MPKTRCPHCRWLGDVDDEQVGLLADCPECGEEFTVEEAKKKKKTLSAGAPAASKLPPSAAAPAGAGTPMVAAPEPSRLSGCMQGLIVKGVSFLIVALVGSVFIYWRSTQTDNAMSTIQVEVAQQFGKGQYDAAYLALAQNLSAEARQKAGTKNLRGNSTGNIDESVYRSELTRLMAAYTADLSPKVDVQHIYSGFWVVTYIGDGGTKWAKYQFKPDGTAYRAYYSDRALTQEILSGERTVTISGNNVTWTGDTIDPDRIILFSKDLMIFDELDGKYTCWMYRAY